MKTFQLRIVAIRRNYYRGPCESLVFTTTDGLVGVLADHEPTVYAVTAGELRYTVDGKSEILAVGEGFARVVGNKVDILVDFAERADEIDAIRAEDAKARAEAALRGNRSDQSMAMAEAALGRAIARLKVAKKARI